VYNVLVHPRAQQTRVNFTFTGFVLEDADSTQRHVQERQLRPSQFSSIGIIMARRIQRRRFCDRPLILLDVVLELHHVEPPRSGTPPWEHPFKGRLVSRAAFRKYSLSRRLRQLLERGEEYVVFELELHVDQQGFDAEGEGL